MLPKRFMAPAPIEAELDDSDVGTRLGTGLKTLLIQTDMIAKIKGHQDKYPSVMDMIEKYTPKNLYPQL